MFIFSLPKCPLNSGNYSRLFYFPSLGFIFQLFHFLTTESRGIETLKSAISWIADVNIGLWPGTNILLNLSCQKKQEYNYLWLIGPERSEKTFGYWVSYPLYQNSLLISFVSLPFTYLSLFRPTRFGSDSTSHSVATQLYLFLTFSTFDY